MAPLGFACLLIAFVLCLYGAGAAIYGVRTGRDSYIESARRSVYALAGVLTVCFAVLEVAFVRNDFLFNTVADTSSHTTPLFYRLAAVWSSQEGSLLLWAWLLSIWSSLALFLTRRRMRDVAAWANAILLGLAAFFIGLMVFYADPFSTTHPVPAEGVGLDPLLRFPTMMIHPPMLYSGYTIAMIPMAFAMGALITRQLDAEWVRTIRRFSFAGWLFLGCGILLGAAWSYSELGWGGYWGWDAVENASLMPWLTATAFLHSLMLQEKRGMLKVWNVSLVLATGVLTVMGTFLVRSGVLNSIHAFGGATLGVPFVSLVALLVIVSIYLVVTRLDLLRSRHRLDSLFSRESIFLLNNIVLVALAFVIFWGTYFPLISRAVTGQEAEVGPPWFDRYTVPLAIVLVLLSGIGPVIAWRRSSLADARRNLTVPSIAFVVVFALAFVFGIAGASLGASLMFAAGAFVVISIVQEFARGVGARRAVVRESVPAALLMLVRRNRRRYGGYIVHVGIVALLLGVAASSSFQHAAEPLLKPGQSTQVGSYQLTYVRPTAQVTPANDQAHTGATLNLGAIVKVTQNGKYVSTLNPAVGYYASDEPAQGSVGSLLGGQPVSHVAISRNLSRDIWTAIAPNLEAPQLQRIVKLGNRTLSSNEAVVALAYLARTYLHNPPPAEFHFIVSPFVIWIWIGGLVLAFGALIAIWPTPQAVRRVVTAGARGRLGPAKA